ncbi:MAG TPA: NapC/NirT family cytochrome c [Candidatus Limnocylindrales bacterium]|nr:NapC/NirT family cytochrome c [Candidatus Limnocylindrales bacterium]
MPRSRGGIVALLLVLGGIGAGLTFGASAAIGWTETADFCGRCHQMGPELAAYEAGPHRDVACAECHVEPGVGGWVKAKLNGTKQLIQVVTGLYPKPVPPPDHSNLPPVSVSCIRCHSKDRLAASAVVTTTGYAEDEGNTREFIGLMIRPGGGDTFDVNRSVHWHVLQDVEFVAADQNSQKIDYVRVARPNGTVEEFLSQDQIRDSADVKPDIKRVIAERAPRRMDCLECHNRAGHPIPNPRKGIDQALSTGRLDITLPFLKREGMSLLVADYPTVEAADAAIASLRGFYTLHYPDVANRQAPEIAAAVTELQRLYRLVAMPDMKVSAKTYPDNLGHTDFPGCFRCHDGGHYLVRNGAATKEVIPATCDTCHTFPQLGPGVASIPFGKPPDTHDDRLWVFDHRNVATSIDPGGQSCGQCHAKDYCENCHKTGAITVKHDEMLLNHAAVIRISGNAACAYCHQRPYCSRCHSEDVLPANGLGGIDPGGTGAIDVDVGPTGSLPTRARTRRSATGLLPVRAPTRRASSWRARTRRARIRRSARRPEG